MPHQKPTPILDKAEQWIRFFEWCELHALTVGDAYEAARNYMAVNSTAQANPGAQLPEGSKDGKDA